MISHLSRKGAHQAGCVHVGRGHIEVQGVQAHWRVQECLLRIAVRLGQESIPWAHPHRLDHLLPAKQGLNGSLCLTWSIHG